EDRMRFRAPACLLIILLFVIPIHPQKQGPPPTRRDDVVDVLHGVRVPDPYRWLEDQKSPETRAWIDAQNAYTKSLLNQVVGRDHISDRLTQLIKTDYIQAPIERNGRYFFRERHADQDQFAILLRQGVSGKDEVLIDPNPISPDHSVSVAALDASEDGSVLAYGQRKGGADEMEIHLLDVDTRKDLSDRL